MKLIPLYCIVSLGITGIVVFGYNSLIDWTALQEAYQNFSEISQNSPTMEILFVAEAQQNIHRINLFAEGVWTLQSAILTAIGLHGICTAPRKTKN